MQWIWNVVVSVWCLLVRITGSRKSYSLTLAAVRRNCHPDIEPLEDRMLLSWTPIGPAPQEDPLGLLDGISQPVTGRISALAVAGNRLLLGAAGGGIWYSDNYTAKTPTWNVTNTDTLGLSTLNRPTGFGAGFIDIGSIAVDPTNPQIVYAGTGEGVDAGDGRYGSGILKSTDGGKTWAVLATGSVSDPRAFFRQTISKIIVDPGNNQRLFAAVSRNDSTPSVNGPAEDDGIYRSLDGGKDWELITGTINPEDPQTNTPIIGLGIKVTDLDYNFAKTLGGLILYAGVTSNRRSGSPPSPDDIGGIWRSTDRGNSWVHIGQQMNNLDGTPSMKPVVGQFRSVDGNPSNLDPNDVERIEFAADHTLGRTLIYAIVSDRKGILLNVYESTNGLTWTALPQPGPKFLGGQGDYNMAIALDTKSGDIDIGGSDNKPKTGERMAYEFSQTTRAWTPIDSGVGGTGPHADQQAFVFVGGQLYAGTDGGLFRYTPSPRGPEFKGTWEDLNTTGLQTSQVWSVAIKPKLGTALLAGFQDNGTAVSTDGGKTWNTVLGGDGVLARFDPRGIDAYASTDHGQLFHSAVPSFFKSWTDAKPKNWVEGLFPFRTVFAISPKDTNLALLGSKRQVLEGGPAYNRNAWNPLNNVSDFTVAAGSSITALTYAPIETSGSVRWSAGIFVGFKKGEIYRSEDRPTKGMRTDWTRLTVPWGNHPISSITPNLNQPGTLYVTLGDFIDAPQSHNLVGQVYMTTDYGRTWTNITSPGVPGRPPGNRLVDGALPNLPVNTLVVDPSRTNGPDLYVGTDAGVYKGVLTPSGRYWTRFDSQ